MMQHIDEGTLRRMQDEPLMLNESQRRHLDTCERCQERAETARTDMRSAATVLASPAPAFDAQAALARFERQSERSSQGSAARRRLHLWHHVYRTPTRAIGGLAAALVVVASLALTPAGSLAQSFVSVFQPQQVQPLYVSMS